jgi:hypothetical protein
MLELLLSIISEQGMLRLGVALVEYERLLAVVQVLCKNDG